MHSKHNANANSETDTDKETGMVSIKEYSRAALRAAHGVSLLTPMLSGLSSGTEMASYGKAQWDFLLRGGDVTAYLATGTTATHVTTHATTPLGTNQGDQPPLLGCLLRVHLGEEGNTAEALGGGSSSPAEAFGMMLVAPEARGRGVARALLERALGEGDAGARRLLAVCTPKGQPLYRRLGFSNAGGWVTALRLDAAGEAAVPPGDDRSGNGNGGGSFRVRTLGSLDNDRGTDAPAIDPGVRSLLIDMDARATGFDRSRRLSFVMGGGGPSEGKDRGSGASAMVAMATPLGAFAADADTDTDTNGGREQPPAAAAIVRREKAGGPCVIGPLWGDREAAVPVVRALVQSVREGARRTGGSSVVSVLVKDHQGLVDRLVEDVGFVEAARFPAMSLDGKPVYEGGDGTYLALMHPTLG
ncbi:unnamed protein product [Pseudo-nitzschia multistriata]|uniref:N-acetyltransferase domain-containing protein n=1 Tax=Pseudo-nitzschia multistriata TaxID=183589 RepID=A0A448ZL01_9STRA|nr:unnamed protein product [Pseudo-nitzschia multistriata]